MSGGGARRKQMTKAWMCINNVQRQEQTNSTDYSMAYGYWSRSQLQLALLTNNFIIGKILQKVGIVWRPRCQKWFLNSSSTGHEILDTYGDYRHLLAKPDSVLRSFRTLLPLAVLSPSSDICQYALPTGISPTVHSFSTDSEWRHPCHGQ